MHKTRTWVRIRYHPFLVAIHRKVYAFGKECLIVCLIGDNFILSVLEKHVFDPKIYVLVERDIRCTIIIVIRIKADLITGFVSIESRTYIRFDVEIFKTTNIDSCLYAGAATKLNLNSAIK